MMKRTLAAVLAMATLAIAAPAKADIQDFKIVNATGYTITHIYVSENDNNNWENDVLPGDGVLADAEETPIHFTGYGEDVCVFDVKVTFENNHDGDSWIVQDVDLCSVSWLKFTWDGSVVRYTKG